jgi:hypothetical protein
MKMEAIWFVRMAKPKARRKPWIPPCLEQLNAWALLLLLFFFVSALIVCCGLTQMLPMLDSDFSSSVWSSAMPIYRGWVQRRADRATGASDRGSVPCAGLLLQIWNGWVVYWWALLGHLQC